MLLCFLGIHYIGEMRNNTLSKLLIEQLTEGQLQFEHLVDDFDVVIIVDLVPFDIPNLPALGSFVALIKQRQQH